jgi:hypothetical protein
VRYSFFYLVFIFFSTKTASSQEIAGRWECVHFPVTSTVFKFEYILNIDASKTSVSGKYGASFDLSKIPVGVTPPPSAMLTFIGKLDMAAKKITIEFDSIPAYLKEAHTKKDNYSFYLSDKNSFIWQYKEDKKNEYLYLTFNNTNPKQRMTDTTLIFSRVKSKKTTPQTDAKPVVVKQVIERVNKIYQTIYTKDDSIKIDLYDNGEIDGDIVSVYLNDKLIKSNLSLTQKAAIYTIQLDKTLKENKLVIYANNLGSIPPNTAYVIITANKKEYRLVMQSDGDTNGAIVFKFDQ